jgi:hypothetical protein
MKRPLLYLLVCSTAIGALLGIVIVLRNQWDWLEVRVVLTTMALAVASLCGLACDLSKTPRGLNILPTAGLVLTFLTTLLILAAIWLEVESEAYWKITAILSIFTVATVHVSLLSIARLAKRFQWVFLLTTQLIYGLAALIAVILLFEIGDESLAQIIAAIAIANVAFTIVIPLLHRISKTDGPTADLMTPLEHRSVATIDEEIARLRRRIADLERLRSEIAGSAEMPG